MKQIESQTFAKITAIEHKRRDVEISKIVRQILDQTNKTIDKNETAREKLRVRGLVVEFDSRLS